MIVAIVDNNTVTNVISITDPSVDGGAAYQVAAQGHQLAIDITDLTPQPVVGWILQGSQLVNATGQPTSWLITKLAFMERFSAINVLGQIYQFANNGTLTGYEVQAYLNMVNAATYIDLSRSDTIADVNILVELGLVTSAQATQVLTTPPTALELYQGD
jgi:hypothetical protein